MQMQPDWIVEGIQLHWYEDGAWTPYKPTLDRYKDGILNFETVKGSHLQLVFTLQELKSYVQATCEEFSCEKVYTLEATLTLLGDEPVAGMLFTMPAHPALKCSWKPHLAPEPDMVIGDKVFRSPAIILEDAERIYALIPDLDHLKRSFRAVPQVMDYSLQEHSLTYGLSDYRVSGHVYYRLDPKQVVLDETMQFRLYLVQWKKAEAQTLRDYRPVERFLWNKFVELEMAAGKRELPVLAELEPYVKHTYGWAFERWKDVCWQQFEIEGVEVGGIVFIVTAKQKPGLGQENVWREPKSLWNQAWFSSLRSAYGYRLWGKVWGRQDLIDKSDRALAFALSAQQTNGLFPGYYSASEDNDWHNGSWIASPPRRPQGHEGYVHLLDSSWTCYWLLKWYSDHEADQRIMPYVLNYVKTLLALQHSDGNFPAWIQPDTLRESPFLVESPENAVHIMLLCQLYELEPNDAYLRAAESAAQFIRDHIIPTGRWEDFETYWSCAKQWDGKQYNVPDKRSGLYNQNTLGMYWCAEAFLALYQITRKPEYLDLGEQVLAELSLYQQIWEPGYIPVPTLGGFGVMNCDDEWNDARQSLFALTYLKYHSITQNDSYRLRGLWAMKASFYMMYCPENAMVKLLYDRVHPHFNEMDYGFHMENFNHNDGTATHGLGEFTIFDWGNGAASTSLGELLHGNHKIQLK